ncbi:hypothetical protein MUB24_17080 [Lederbergia sp. NSJ-179]|uniref:hypothetical protein n=1 Tax=Lederbergia sp. NSJ-179 TaxID=2931402 RepID=UPI001FD0F148|nr:hypothetical protein [Lederbergia sp. NSJ-179]MCJ7842579.1 hypothetical protein [Lederbergia sp. NSJ-179]
MLKMTIRQENQKPRTIRLPYFFIGSAGRIATFKSFWKIIGSRRKQNQEEVEYNEKLSFEQIDWRDIKPVLKEIKKYKGLTIVEVHDKNGQNVKIEL